MESLQDPDVIPPKEKEKTECNISDISLHAHNYTSNFHFLFRYIDLTVKGRKIGDPGLSKCGAPLDLFFDAFSNVSF